MKTDGGSILQRINTICIPFCPTIIRITGEETLNNLTMMIYSMDVRFKTEAIYLI